MSCTTLAASPRLANPGVKTWRKCLQDEVVQRVAGTSVVGGSHPAQEDDEILNQMTALAFLLESTTYLQLN
jgi:CO dehydrogenase/acetyl-CoA synthase delta subunit